MMLIHNTFELSIPTHISFTLYKFDYIDSVIISRVKKECKNYNNTDDDGIYTVKSSSFINCLTSSPRLMREIQKAEMHIDSPSPEFKPNSVYFLWTILSKLHNVEWLSFKISYDKKFSRIVKHENRNIVNFHFNILEGLFDLTQVFNREELDIINKKIIEFGIMPNKYLERSPYFYMKASVIYEILGTLEMDGILSTFDLLDHIDQKLEDDDPVLTVKTDYTPY